VQTAFNIAVPVSMIAPGGSSSDYSLSALSDGASGQDIVISYAPTPEPTSFMLLGLGFAGLTLRRRRRSQLV